MTSNCRRLRTQAPGTVSTECARLLWLRRLVTVFPAIGRNVRVVVVKFALVGTIGAIPPGRLVTVFESFLHKTFGDSVVTLIASSPFLPLPGFVRASISIITLIMIGAALEV